MEIQLGSTRPVLNSASGDQYTVKDIYTPWRPGRQAIFRMVEWGKTWLGLFIFISPILDTELWGDPKGGTWWM